MAEKERWSGLRFEKGSKVCGFCDSNKEIIQFERKTKRKRLPIIEIAFICKTCAEKKNLIKDSKELLERKEGGKEE